MAGLVGQSGLFPGDRRLRELDLLGDGLPLPNRLIPWERFRPILESVPKAKPKGPGGRKPYDRMLLFKMMVLQQLHNLSDEQTEYQVRDRLSFQRFLGIGLEEAVPDHTTLWLFRESLAQAQLTGVCLRRLFTAFCAKRATRHRPDKSLTRALSPSLGSTCAGRNGETSQLQTAAFLLFEVTITNIFICVQL